MTPYTQPVPATCGQCGKLIPAGTVIYGVGHAAVATQANRNFDRFECFRDFLAQHQTETGPLAMLYEYVVKNTPTVRKYFERPAPASMSR